MNCGRAFEPGASALPYYCTSICARSFFTWRASSVDSKPKKKRKASPELCYVAPWKGGFWPDDFSKRNLPWKKIRVV